MSKILYEKCICFIFLITLVILSCSGFPIDNTVMVDNSKRNSHTSNSFSRSDDFLNRIFNLRSTQNIETLPSHKIRHRRPLRAQTRALRTHKMPMGHIEAIVIPNDDDSLPTTNELFAQIPSTDTYRPLPSTKSTISRSQRSYSNRRHQLKSQECNQEHFSAKAYKANVVLHATAQSIRSHRRSNRTSYWVHFKVLRQLKHSPFPIHDGINLQFSNSTTNCAKENHHNSRKNLVKAEIRASQEYILFLNVSSDNKYSAVSAPELIGRKKRKEDMMNLLEKVCSSNFKPKPTSITKLADKSSWKVRNRKKRKNQLKLVCRAAGLPFPRISWRRDNITITNSTHIRINYVKRRSTLVIQNPENDDFGRYECVARGVNGAIASKSVEVLRPTSSIPTTPSTPFSEIDSRKPCEPPFNKDFCLNEGQCFMDPDPLERYCECPDGFSGKRCAEKTSYQPASMYPQTSLYTCKLGLSTKYYC